MNYSAFKTLVEQSSTITVVQAENPDADSLGSAIALGEILQKLGKTVHQHCAVDIPKYLRYINGWEQVSAEFDTKSDLVIIVDTSAESLVEKTMQLFDITTTPTVIFDHHKSEATIQNATIFNDPTKAATSELLYECTQELEWEIPENAAKAMIYSILGDTLGLTSHGTTNSTIATFSSLVIDHNINLGQLDERRRELGKKPFSIFKYKQALMSRVEFHFDNQLATVDIPLEEIKEHSDLYNPAALFMEELRPVEGIRMAIAFKVYEDRITAKLREINDAPFCNRLAEHFGGGGHPFAAGFKVKRTDLAELKKEVLKQFYDLSEQA